MTISRHRSWAACLILGMLFACGDSEDVDPLEGIRRTGELVVLTRNGSTTFYVGRDGADGYEFALTQALAEYLDVTARYQTLDSIPEVLMAMDEGRGHLAAAALTRTEERESRYRFGPDYKAVQQQVVCHRDGPVPGEPAELVSVEMLLLAGSSYDERLRELQQEIPELSWQTTDELSTDEILEKVWRREVDCAVADSNIVAINRRYFPELAIAFPITEEQSLAWVLPGGAEDFQALLETWMQEMESTGLLERLNERFYGHANFFDYVDIKRYQKRIEKRLPKYQSVFEEAAGKYDLPWILLAAVSYQESQWNPRAKSPTGVRGMMMLTLPTAKAMGVENRLDPHQSIVGGAKYLARMLGRVPDAIQGHDRLWFALAAYNVGFGHVQDARELAKRLGRHPNQWHDVKAVLPLLARKKYYGTLKYGYARGSEPVRYVERIRGYRDVLEWRLSGRGGATRDQS